MHVEALRDEIRVKEREGPLKLLTEGYLLHRSYFTIIITLTTIFTDMCKYTNTNRQ